MDRKWQQPSNGGQTLWRMVLLRASANIPVRGEVYVYGYNRRQNISIFAGGMCTH